MPLRPSSDEAVIIIVGAFNPAIFQPQWFLRNELITEAEAASTDTPDLVLSSDVAQFTTPWLRWQALRGKLDVRTQDPTRFTDLRDVVVAALSLLAQTPVTAMGLNRGLHFQMPTAEAANKIGDRLAPKAPWLSVLSEPGLLKMQMRGKHSMGFGTGSTVTVGPSDRIAGPSVAIDVGAAAFRSKRRRDALKDIDRLDGVRSVSDGEAC